MTPWNPKDFSLRIPCEVPHPFGGAALRGLAVNLYSGVDPRLLEDEDPIFIIDNDGLGSTWRKRRIKFIEGRG